MEKHHGSQADTPHFTEDETHAAQQKGATVTGPATGSLVPRTVRLPDTNPDIEEPLYLEALKQADLELADLSPVQRRLLIVLQEPGAHFLKRTELAEAIGCDPVSVSRALNHPGFSKMYMFLQNIVLLEHLPEIDKATMMAAKSPDSTYQERDLAYRRLGVFDGKKGGLTINVQQNAGGAEDEDRRRVCPADDFVGRWKDLEGNPGRGKKTIIQTPDSD